MLFRSGLEVHITEMDVSIMPFLAEIEEGKFDRPVGDDPMRAALKRQADIYADMLEAALRVDRFTVFQTWGYTDRYTWVHGYLNRPEDRPLLLSEDYERKPAWEAIEKVLAAPPAR